MQSHTAAEVAPDGRHPSGPDREPRSARAREEGSRWESGTVAPLSPGSGPETRHWAGVLREEAAAGPGRFGGRADPEVKRPAWGAEEHAFLRVMRRRSMKRFT